MSKVNGGDEDDEDGIDDDVLPTQGPLAAQAPPAGKGQRKKQRVQAEEHIPVQTATGKRKAAALKRRSDLDEAAAALPVYFVRKEGRAQIRAAVGAMVLTTEFGKKYKCLWVYRCVC